MTESTSGDSPATGGSSVAPFGIETEFRRLLDRLPAGAYTCDPDGLITYFNEHAVVLWGRAPKLNDPMDRFCGSFKLYLADGTPIDHDRCWMGQALETGSAFNGEEIIVERPDGTRLTALAHANPIRDESGKIIGAVNVLIDISDRKRAEEVQRLLAAIVESSEDAIISKTLTGRILTWNSSAERLLGYPAEEAIGKSILMIIPPERQHEEQTIIERLRRGERIEHYETVRLTKDERRIDVSLSISPVRDDKGQVIAASKVLRDITAQKQAQQAVVALKEELAIQLADLRRLHEMSSRLSTTLELQPILDETLRAAVAIENADMGLLSLCDGEGQGLSIGTSIGFQPEFLNLIHRASSAGACGTCYSERRRVVVPDIEVDPIFEPYRDSARKAGFRAVHSTPLITRGGKIIGVLSTHFRRPYQPSTRTIHLIDLCARQAVEFIENARLYNELRAADRSKEEFLAVLAHELRNPLAPIRNSLHIMRLSGELTSAGERVQDVMERQVSHLVRLVDDLMEVSRISRGKIELRKEPVELAEVMASAVEASRPLIEEARHQLAISLPTEPLTLEADGIRVAQIMSNLLNNAAKYTEPGGQIWLTARRDAGDVVISVRDTGIGIPPEKLPHVFDMFAQVHGMSYRNNGGLGIGLTLVRRLVELHGGRIEARSGGLGKGSEFTVRLPLSQRAVEAPVQKPRKPERSVPLANKQVLVVDDNHDAADSLAMFLKFLGASVQVAYDGTAAIDMVAKSQPEIVLLDIGMPMLDGYEVARRLRELPEGRDLLLVAMTGWGQEEDKRRTASAGFDHHLVKPVDPVKLEKLLAGFSPKDATERVAAQ
jgi:PAS domain S-box-containing protein